MHDVWYSCRQMKLESGYIVIPVLYSNIKKEKHVKNNAPLKASFEDAHFDIKIGWAVHKLLNEIGLKIGTRALYRYSCGVAMQHIFPHFHSEVMLTHVNFCIWCVFPSAKFLYFEFYTLLVNNSDMQIGSTIFGLSFDIL